MAIKDRKIETNMKEYTIPRRRAGWLKVSRERAAAVVEEISLGSEPRFSFYVLLITSSLIASFGLIANSTAVVIGAMLVSPLMTPILGIALALVRGDARLLRRALLAEVVGVVLAVGMATLFGLLPVNIEATPEMLARTEPNLLDLLVAVLAGFAGAYAMVDERISPALPGVAIATAIVPPLSNTGLCLALGAYEGACGSFLLFLANFLSMLLIASVIFFFAGLAPKLAWTTPWDLTKRFSWAVLGFVLVGVLLTGSLVRIVEKRRLDRTIKRVLADEFSKIHAFSMDNIVYEQEQDILYILTTVRSPTLISPGEVKTIQDSLGVQLGLPAELIVRNILSKDITAKGSDIQITVQNLDGEFITQEISPRKLKERNAEQVLWDEFAARPNLELIDVTYRRVPMGPIILANVCGLRSPDAEEIRHLEETIQERLQDSTIQLVVRFTQSSLLTQYGPVLYGWSTAGGEVTPEKEATVDKIQTAVREELSRYPDVFLLRLYPSLREDRFRILVEVVGNGVITSKDLVKLEEGVSKKIGQPLEIYIWTRDDTVVTESGVVPFKAFLKKEIPEWEKLVWEAGRENKRGHVLKVE
ncbi:MAG: TIGR00341 family protein [Desulfobacterales bacterium S5133MH4]|nr:MAG: TIGR00341 family protein [Desulfobacterales bacterium S5133MH4]